MPRILVLPERKTITVRGNISVSKLLSLLDIDDPDEVAIVVNNKLIDDLSFIIKDYDRVLVIRQGIGG